MHNNKLLITFFGIFSILFTMTAQAAVAKDSGIYLEGNVGYGKVDEKVVGSSKQDNKGFLGGANLGYKINQNVAVEAGFMYLPTEKFDAGIKGTENYFFDIAVKGILPFDNGFNVFGKLGVAYVHHTLEGPVSNSGTHKEFTGLFGAGVGYNVTENIEVNAQALFTNKNGNVPANYMGTVGISYLF